MAETIVTLKKGEGRSLKSGGLWIYDNEIDTIMGAFQNGDLVVVHDFDGYGMGRGFINQNSKIRIRMMTRDPNQQIDREFLKRRVREAWTYRQKTVDTSSCRVVFGEADFLPGIVIDKYTAREAAQSADPKDNNLLTAIENWQEDNFSDLQEVQPPPAANHEVVETGGVSG